jgi:hypothetical protein
MLETLLAALLHIQTLAPYALQTQPLLDIPSSAQDAADRCAAGTLQAQWVNIAVWPDGSRTWMVVYGVWGDYGLVTQGPCLVTVVNWK